MAITVKNGYECGYCRKFFTSPVDADRCKEEHQLLYISLSREDLNRLLLYIQTGEEKAIMGRGIVERLQGYLKGSFHFDNTIEKVYNGQKEV